MGPAVLARLSPTLHSPPLPQRGLTLAFEDGARSSSVLSCLLAQASAESSVRLMDQ
ncbi:hypothetical protein Mapa_004712 [Marchantia paleacea]|nr:hypothetical protein Mapa_004712 [Marchantia paleacea]